MLFKCCFFAWRNAFRVSGLLHFVTVVEHVSCEVRVQYLQTLFRPIILKRGKQNHLRDILFFFPTRLKSCQTRRKIVVKKKKNLKRNVNRNVIIFVLIYGNIKSNTFSSGSVQKCLIPHELHKLSSHISVISKHPPPKKFQDKCEKLINFRSFHTIFHSVRMMCETFPLQEGICQSLPSTIRMY